jgi:hypothetical protein
MENGSGSEECDGERVLLSPDEWTDPPECQVISEYHKEGADVEDKEEEDPDLQAFIDLWKARSSHKVLSEYHKEGAPYLDSAFLDGPPSPVHKIEPGELIEEPAPIPEVAKIKEIKDIVVKEEELKEAPKPKTAAARLERVIDITTIEFLAFTVIRALFPRRVRYALQKEGVVDMDITIDDRDITFNSNRLVFEVPEMSIWKLIFAYKGKPVVELGRGVKNGLKLHRMRILRVGLDMWLAERRKAKKKKKKGKGKKRAKKKKRG